MVEHFQIRTDVLCHYYNVHSNPQVLETLVKLLGFTEANEATSDLYNGFLQRQSESVKATLLDKLPDREHWEKEGYLTSKCCREMVKQMREIPDITTEDSFNMVLYHFTESDFVVPQRGIVLNKKIQLERDDHPATFGVLFSFVLSLTTTPADFLNAHLTESFNGDRFAFQEFLTLMLDDNSNLLTARRTTIQLWIKNNIESPRTDRTIISYTQDQIALSIVYRQMGGSITPWELGLKEKAIKNIAEEHGKSWKALLLSYNKFSKPGSEADRLKALAYKDNKQKVLELLEGDPTAINELNTALRKNRTP